MWDYPMALLSLYMNVPGIMSPRDKNFLILIWWLAKCFCSGVICYFSWTIVISEFCHHLEIHLFRKHLGRWKVLLAARELEQRGPESIKRRMSKWQGPFYFSNNVNRNQYTKHHKSTENMRNILLASEIGTLPILQEYPIGHICHAGTLYKNRFFIHLGCFQNYVFTVNHKYCLVCYIFSGW